MIFYYAGATTEAFRNSLENIVQLARGEVVQSSTQKFKTSPLQIGSICWLVFKDCSRA